MFGFGNNKPGRTVEECQDMIKRSFQKPMVKFLREKLAKAGCNVGDDFFHAVDCEKDVSGGYISGYGIQVCSNQITLQDEVNQVIIHELIHAYDDCRSANMDWSNCAHHACSEIRAGHLSGDCHFKRELLRNGFHKLRGHGSLHCLELIERDVVVLKVARVDCLQTQEDAAAMALEELTQDKDEVDMQAAEAVVEKGGLGRELEKKKKSGRAGEAVAEQESLGRELEKKRKASCQG